jgi:AraC family transcriptional regulator
MTGSGLDPMHAPLDPGTLAGQAAVATFETQARMEAVDARLQIALIHHPGADASLFRREGEYWIDLCATPRRPSASGSFVEHWGPHRYVELGSLIAFPPGQTVQIRNAGGRHVSLICQLRSEALERHLPSDFVWSDHRREACLNISSERLRSGFMRLYHELRSPGLGSNEFCSALVTAISIEFARFLLAVDEPDQKGGLSPWRQRLIEERVAAAGPLPTAGELAAVAFGPATAAP